MRCCAVVSVFIFVLAAPLHSQREYLLGDFDQSGDLSISDAVMYFDWTPVTGGRSFRAGRGSGGRR